MWGDSLCSFESDESSGPRSFCTAQTGPSKHEAALKATKYLDEHAVQGTAAQGVAPIPFFFGARSVLFQASFRSARNVPHSSER